MQFGNPHFFWWMLVVVPAIAAGLWWAWRQRQILAVRFIESRLLTQLTVGLSRTRQGIRLAALVVAIAFLFLALARPQRGHEWIEAEHRGLDILIAMDTSRSMLANDLSPNRLERAKFAVQDLMKLARYDRLGLIAFSGTAFLQCPLTLDDSAFLESLNALDTDIIPQGGTSVSEPVGLALETFEKEEDNSKVLVLFTDGEDHEEGVPGMVEKAAEAGLKIFTIGLGTREGELIQLTQPETGKREFLKDNAGNVVKSRLNESLLREIAAKTGGFYLPLRGADTMKQLYESGLSGMSAKAGESKLVKRFRERFQWPLGVAILLLIFELVFPERYRREQWPGTGSAKSSTLGVALILLALPITIMADSPGEALQRFEAGDYEDALEVYENLLEDTPDDARLNYNAGAAAYRAGDFKKAGKYFEDATSAPDEVPLELQERAYYNLGNTLFRLGEAATTPEEKKERWMSALKKYEGATQLASRLEQQDPDAQFNIEVVKKRLEQLQQQQQQNQQGDPNKDENQQDQENEQEQQQQNSQEEENKQQQQSQQEQQQNSEEGEGEQEQQQKEQGQEEEQEDAQKKQPDSAREEEKKQPQPDKEKEQPQDGTPMKPGKMTREQVRQLLDAQKQKEGLYRPKLKVKNRRQIFKNW